MGKLGEILSHPDEIVPLARMYVAAKRAARLPSDPDLAFCYDVLNRVSRSFAVVIQQLPQPLRDAVCVFYLVLRGLDTVEDDMALDDGVKVPALLSFHERIFEPGFHMDGVGYGEYVRLMERFATVVDAFLALGPRFRAVIADITRRMGAGMAEFIADRGEVRTVEEYDLYCHYVAGLVGVGLSQLFAACGLEDAKLGCASYETLSNHMGLFLQKANIIRDYLEDIEEEPAPRMFWPRDVWGRYATRLADLKEPSNRAAALAALDDLVTDALRHLPHCVAYLRALRHPDVFRFCAIPQVMALATYGMCYDNGRVFEGVVKMRRGETARVFGACGSMAGVLRWFSRSLEGMRAKADARAAAVEARDPAVVGGLGVAAAADAQRRVRATQRAVEGAVALCRAELAKEEAREAEAEAEAAAAAAGGGSGTALDASLVVLAGAWAYSAFGMGEAGGYRHYGGGGHPLVSDSLAQGPIGALAGLGGRLLPEGWEGAERAVALALLLATLARLVFGREAARAV